MAVFYEVKKVSGEAALKLDMEVFCKTNKVSGTAENGKKSL